MKNNVTWAIVLVVVLLLLAEDPFQKQNIVIGTGSDSSLANLVDADVAFYGHRMFQTGTALTSENVRVFQGDQDLGSKSLNAGTLAVTPLADYTFYFFMNSTEPSSDYYVDIMEWTAEVQDSTIDLIGEGCSIDDGPIVTVRDSAGNVQTASQNAEAIASGGTVDLEIDIKVHSDQCYGTPGAPVGNAICFDYDSSIFSTVKPNTRWISVPLSVTDLDLGTVKCYEFPVLKDTERTTLTVKLTASAEPTVSHNISIYTDDIAFDFRADNLQPIWDFTDEDRNQLARTINTTADAVIYVS